MSNARYIRPRVLFYLGRGTRTRLNEGCSFPLSLEDPTVQEIVKGLVCKVTEKGGELYYVLEIGGKERLVSARSALIEMLKKLLGRMALLVVP